MAVVRSDLLDDTSARGDLVLTENEARLLAEPSVTLHVGTSAESVQAFEVLEQAGLGFRVVHSSRQRVPFAEWGGIRFRRLSGVLELVSMLHGFDAVFLAKAQTAMPHLFEHGDERLSAWMTEIRKRQLAEARAAMYSNASPEGRKRRVSSPA